MSEPQAPEPQAARRRWFEQYGGVQVANGRIFIAALALAAVALGEAAAIVLMAPLKTVVPYVIQVDKSGAVSAASALARRYVPGQNEIAWGLSRWILDMLTIDRYLTGDPRRNNVLEAYAMTRGKAVAEFNDWFAAENPIRALAQDPSLTRVVHIRNWAAVHEGEMIFRVTTVRRSSGAKQGATENLMLSIHYIVVPPKTEQEIMTNPLGLFVTHFALQRDLG